MEGRKRVEIGDVSPQIECGRYAVKRIVGDDLTVRADIVCDGHDEVTAVLLYRRDGEETWRENPMVPLGNDRWEGKFPLETLGEYRYTVSAWVDQFRTWQRELQKRYKAGQDLETEFLIGLGYIESAAEGASGEDAAWLRSVITAVSREGDVQLKVALCQNSETTRLVGVHADRTLAVAYRELSVVVGRERVRFSTWYELFPRSWGSEPGRHGTLLDCQRLLPEIARMGFDVLYLPPIHPIGRTSRKGINNRPDAQPGDPGSPWAIGAAEGGHMSIHPELGSMEDFVELVRKAGEHNIELALDIAFQCSPDHPYVQEHPEWFLWRPDGTVQYAENPPKKYQDIVPFYFETALWQELWQELKKVVLFWRDKGVRIFRVDNPHTKPFPFWEWLLGQIIRETPDVIFLAEAFTRPKVMYRLAKLGFSQSYTYFTWRTTSAELKDYMKELTRSEVKEFFRPNFWPNTPDILPEHLQYGGRPAFMIRLVLAATLSSNYGIYGPAFELCINKALPGKEEYLDGEKYEIRHWDWDAPGNLKEFVATVNGIRRENPALQSTDNIIFHETDNDNLIFYSKCTADRTNILLVIVSLDPFNTQTGTVRMPLEQVGIAPGHPYLLHDLLSDEKLIWQGERNRVQFDPHVAPARIFRIHPRLRREFDFDYFM